MTTAAPTIDLESLFLIETADPGEACDWNTVYDGSCPREAVCRILWEMTDEQACTCNKMNPTPYCEGHKSQLLEGCKLYDSWFLCTVCDGYARLVRVLPLRG